MVSSIQNFTGDLRPYVPHNHELSLPRSFVIVWLSPALRAPVCASLL
jgi:hypothetical protein